MARYVLPGGQVVEARHDGDLARVYQQLGARPDYGNPTTGEEPADDDALGDVADAEDDE